MLRRVSQNNFTGGEMSPWMDARLDVEKYSTGARLFENALPRPEGAAIGRGGFVYAGTAKYNNRVTRLRRFQFNKTQAYMLEIGHQYIRIFKNHAPLTINRTVSNASVGQGGKIRITTSAAHGYTDGWTVTITGVAGTTEANGTFTLNVVDATNFDLSGTAFSNPYTSGGTCAAVIDIASGYLEEDLRALQFSQSGDTMYVTHEDYAPSKLTRANDESWSLNVVNFVDGPYFDENKDTAKTITPSAATGNITLVANFDIFDVGHVGGIFRLKVASNPYGYVEITGVTDAQNATATVIDTLTTAAATSVWREGMWSDYRGYPSTSTFHEQRTVWDGGPGAPTTIVGSVSDSPEDMTPGAADDDSYVFSIGSNEQNAIRWLSTGESLLCGTEAEEFSIVGENDAGITPTSVLVRSRTAHGSNFVQPVRVANQVLFTQRTGKKLRAIEYQLTADVVRAANVGRLASHILETYGLVDIAYQQEPFSTLWGVREDATLVGITYIPEENIVAWHRHPSTNGAVQSVGTVPSPTFDRDEIWISVIRTINGVSVQTIEYEDPTNYGLDCASIYTGAAVTVVPVSSHLNGHTVSIVADDAVYPNQQVVNGTITLPNSATASTVRVGIKFNGKLQLLRPESDTPQGGSTQGLPRSWKTLRALFKDTMGVTVGTEQIPYRKSTNPMGSPVPLYTGYKLLTLPAYTDHDGIITIEQTVPLQWGLLAIFGLIDFGVDV